MSAEPQEVSHAFHDDDRCLKCPDTRATHYHDREGWYCTRCDRPHGAGPVPYACVVEPDAA